MKARPMPALDGAASLGVNVARILAVRVDELRSFVPRALDPDDVEASHDLRIAAKRLRYVLEIAGEACVGPPAVRATKLIKELQDVLGEMHDCDVMLPRLAAVPGDGIDQLTIHLARRRQERFARFRELWPEVEEAATSCSHAAADRALLSDAQP